MDEARVMEVLRRVEWALTANEEFCPYCYWLKRAGHKDDCKLAALLGEANETEKIKLRSAALTAIADAAHALRTQANMRRVVHSNADYIPAYLLAPLYEVLDDFDALDKEQIWEKE